MTFDDRVVGLENFGLTQRQARFVVMVALHGGYCLRRQYATFLGVQYGVVVRQFLDKLVGLQLMARVAYRANRGFVYHLSSKSVYRAIGEDDNRNRRTTSPALIARKLMLLDVVLSMPAADWMATEADKVALFTGEFGVPIADLPQRVYDAHVPRAAATTRYFIHKWPVYVTREPRAVHFVVLSLDASGRAFEQFLLDHARLLAHLPQWELLVVSPVSSSGADACRAAFERYQHATNSPLLMPSPELERHFATRKAIEAGDINAASVDDLQLYRKRRDEWRTPALETLYARWRRIGSNVWQPSGDLAGRPVGNCGSLRTYQLPFNYSQFGDLPGEC